MVCICNCVLTDMTTQSAVAAQGDNPARPAINIPTGVTFKMTDTKLYASRYSFNSRR